MNVLVYSGSEVHPNALANTVSLLGTVCLPHYTVQPLSKATFLKEPWEIDCKLFVIPYIKPASPTGRATEQGKSRPLDIFGPKEVKRLRTFVEKDGGVLLGIGLGARWETATTISSLESSMSRLGFGGSDTIKAEDLREDLKFKDDSLNSYVVPETSPHSVSGDLQGDGDVVQVANVDLTDAKIALPDNDSHINDVVRSVGKGKVGIVRPTLVSLTKETLEDLAPWLHAVILRLGLVLPEFKKDAPVSATSTAEGPPKSLPQFLTSIPSADDNEPPKPIASTVVKALFPTPSTPSIGTIKDTADTFNFLSHDSKEAREALQHARDDNTEESKEKTIIVCPDGVLPSHEDTPMFNIKLFYDTLRRMKATGQPELRVPMSETVPEGQKSGWGFGEALLYGERVTSTQSLLDKNPQLMSGLPTPLISLASQQMSGRGRGKNPWLSPAGSMMVSLLLRIELDPGGSQSSGSQLKGTGSKTSKTTSSGTKTTSQGTPSSDSSTSTTAGLKTKLKSEGSGQMGYAFSSPHVPPPALPRLPASSLVFVQYLFALAVTEACSLPEVLGPKLGRRVRLKWPNDIYVDLSDEGVGTQPTDWSKLKKIGGVLVNTNFTPGGKVDLLIGCGVNTLNEPPIVSLLQLKKQFSGSDDVGELSLERMVASVITVFERMWSRFVYDGGSFAAFESTYLYHWLHKDQKVMLTTVQPPVPVRIVGITPDYGLLRTVAEKPLSQSGGVGSVGLGLPLSYARYVYPGGEKQEYIDLQPDGNSFDLMAGLIKAKTY